MDVRTWTPDARAVDDLAQVSDPQIYERLAKPRAFDGQRPGYLDEALEHCAKPLILREVGRAVHEVGEIHRAAVPLPSGGATGAARRLPRLERLTRECGRVPLASRSAARAHRAVRALVRVLLSQPYRG